MYCFEHLSQEYLQWVMIPSVHLVSQNILQSFDAFLIAISNITKSERSEVTSPKHLQCFLLEQKTVQKLLLSHDNSDLAHLFLHCLGDIMLKLHSVVNVDIAELLIM